VSKAAPTATVAIATRGRPGYLYVTLASIAPQARAAGAELLVALDGPDPELEALARAAGARVVALPRPTGANAARNAAIREARSELIVFADDDVEAPAGWLESCLEGARANPGHEVFGGPILPRLEGGGPPCCGGEPAPITSLEAGPLDRDVESVWSANMAVRARAFRRVGLFDERLQGRGEEEEWQERLRDSGGRIRYLAAAGLVHRRSAHDASLRSLAGAAYRLGESARRNDVRKGTAPSRGGELRGIAGGLWHACRRRCAYGIVFAAHAVGRTRASLRHPAGNGGR
jgi:GT2 family glycosyltransferase